MKDGMLTAHLTTLSLLGKRSLAEVLAGGHVLFCPSDAAELLPQDGAEPIFALEPLEDNRWCVRTSNLVGFLECNGLTISIGSRFDPEDGSSFFLPYLIARTLHIPPLELDWEQVSVRPKCWQLPPLVKHRVGIAATCWRALLSAAEAAI